MAKLTLTPQQQAVVENRGGSLLVSAAAGSGKTKVLVDRLFRYVTEERCNIDDFLIITYTKAAAAELRSKIASELSKRLGQTPGDQQLRRQLLRVYQADIKTVDAFCTSLLRENTHLLAREGGSRALSPDFRGLDDTGAPPDRPGQDQHGQSRKQKAHEGHIPLPRQRMCRQQGRQVVQQPLQDLHGSASSLETELHSLLL